MKSIASKVIFMMVFSTTVSYAQWDQQSPENRETENIRVDGNARFLGNAGVGTSTNGSFKLWVQTTGSSTPYGIRVNNYYNGSSNKYGIYSYVNSTGTGNKYGIYSNVSTSGSGTKYGLYSSAPGGSSWAGYFMGRGYFSEKVGIGTSSMNCPDCGDYNLFVTKGIRTEKVKVDVASGDWSDYVFDDDYALKSLGEVDQFIAENKHLPGVPSAVEVEEGGLDLAQMDAILLKKIEELTLYMIELKKENEALKAALETQK